MTGKEGERMAAEFLMGCGYRILERNYRTPFGEIDIIAQDGKMLVFVEVKARSGDQFGVPQSAVNGRKQGKMSRVALAYMSQKKLTSCECRFDVVGILSQKGAPRIEHFRNAFEALETGTGC